MSLVRTLKALAAAGGTAEQLIAVVEAHEAEREAAAADRRAKDAARQAAKRDRERHAESRDVTRTERDSRGPSPRVCERDAQVVNTTSSLRSEGNPPPTPNGVGAPKGAETARGTRLSEGWEPDADGWAYAIEHLGSPQLAHAEADKFRDYWRAVPGAKGRKSDWPATWRNWTRRASETRPRKAHAERPHPDNRQAAREANYAAAFRGADLASRQRWEP